jgi:putative alpha-1,2-mannosidase
MAGIGLFDVKGLTAPDPSFQIGSPLFNKVTIQCPGRGTFVIEADNNSKENIYIQEAILNGKVDKDLRLPFADFAKGGILKLKMTR